MHALRILFAALAIGALAGCARFEPKPVSAERTLAEFEGRTLESPGLRAYIETNCHTNFALWPLRAWGLQKLTLAAFYYSPDLDLARAQWAVAQAGTKTAGERPNPTLGVAPALSTSVYDPSPWLVTPTLDVPIETAGKRGHRIAQAKALSEAARLDIASAAWRVRGKVRKALLEIHSADAANSILEQQQAIQDENVALLERQHDAGAISAFELAQARATRDSAKLALLDAVAQSAAARVGLADTLGVAPSALDGARFLFSDVAQLPDGLQPPQARRQALLSRADILSALALYAASQSALQLEIAKQYPDVNLGPGYEYDQGNNKWSLGLPVTLPLLNQNKGAIAEAAARREEAAARFNAAQARALSEIDAAWAAAKAAFEKRASAGALLANAQKQEQLSRSMHEAGEFSKAELAAQRLQASALEAAHLDAVVKSQQALGDLEDALQSPLDLPASAWQNPPRPQPSTRHP